MTKNIRPAEVIRKYYSNNPVASKILLDHSRLVTKKSLKIARDLLSQGKSIDLKFVAEAAMLHDIGMFLTDTPELGCNGEGSYLQHGIKGKELLEKEGLFKHARVCERHIGVGLTAAEIEQQQLPLPARDMQPETLEEQIICYADLFYSKGKNKLGQEKQPEEVRGKLKRYGKDKVEVFDRWLKMFEPELR
ncbi:MAG: HD domain-containing protein [Thermodesulfobacteriota bacterium]|nr:HD domain-containing protein [Thermodesulfobacteriota bacterium]